MLQINFPHYLSTIPSLPAFPHCRLKSYEGKLATLTAINAALQAEADSLRGKLADASQPASVGEMEIAELKEEFARRLAGSERQIATLQDEKAHLRAQLNLAAQGGNTSSARLADQKEHIQSLQ
jgi:hypothetical protein